MKVSFNTIIFCESQKTYKHGDNTITEFFDDENTLIRRDETDSFGRNTDSKRFDKNGNITESIHKDYFKTESEEGFIETFKSKYQEYTRKAYTRTENGIKHTIDDFHSKSGKNYYNDFIHDLNGKLIRIISNGKVTELK